MQLCMITFKYVAGLERMKLKATPSCTITQDFMIGRVSKSIKEYCKSRRQVLQRSIFAELYTAGGTSTTVIGDVKHSCCCKV